MPPNKALQPTPQPPLRYGCGSAELGRYTLMPSILNLLFIRFIPLLSFHF